MPRLPRGRPEEIQGRVRHADAERFFSGGDSEKNPVVPGKPEESVLYISVTRTDSSLAMPPKENDKLSEAQVEIIKHWILDGGIWPDAGRIAEITEEQARAPKAAATGETGVKVTTSGGLSDDWTNRPTSRRICGRMRRFVACSKTKDQKADVPLIASSAPR